MLSDPVMVSGQIREKIRTFLCDTYFIEFGDQLRDEDHLFHKGVLDSFGFIQMVAFLEREFQIKITQEEMLSDALTSVLKMSALIQRKTAANQ